MTTEMRARPRKFTLLYARELASSWRGPTSTRCTPESGSGEALPQNLTRLPSPKLITPYFCF